MLQSNLIFSELLIAVNNLQYTGGYND